MQKIFKVAIIKSNLNFCLWRKISYNIWIFAPKSFIIWVIFCAKMFDLILNLKRKRSSLRLQCCNKMGHFWLIFQPLCSTLTVQNYLCIQSSITTDNGKSRTLVNAAVLRNAILASSRSTLDLAGAEPSPLPAAKWYRGMVHLQNKLLRKWFHSRDFILLC